MTPAGVEVWIAVQIILGVVLLLAGVILAAIGRGFTAGSKVSFGLAVICFVGAAFSARMIVPTGGLSAAQSFLSIYEIRNTSY